MTSSLLPERPFQNGWRHRFQRNTRSGTDDVIGTCVLKNSDFIVDPQNAQNPQNDQNPQNAFFLPKLCSLYPKKYEKHESAIRIHF
jgi:hypothetical protein